MVSQHWVHLNHFDEVTTPNIVEESFDRNMELNQIVGSKLNGSCVVCSAVQQLLDLLLEVVAEEGN